MGSPLVIGSSIAAAALTSRYLISAWHAFRSRPRRFYPGGFEQVMTRTEAARILGVRDHATLEKIKEAHRRLMVANHPDCGGSHYLAMKVKEAKEVLRRSPNGSGSAF